MKAPEEASNIYLPETSVKSRYDYLIYIGRFQPFHLGHKHVVETACAISDNVIILCGSCNVPRTTKNPFTFAERQDYIEKVFENTKYKNQIIVNGLDDCASNSEWIIQVQNKIHVLTKADLNDNIKIGIVGHQKDDSSWYLEKLNVDFFEVGIYLDEKNVAHRPVDSTNIRRNFFRNEMHDIPLPDEMTYWLKTWSETSWETYEYLQKEEKYITEYRASWGDYGNSPFPVQFITVDAVVIQQGHILLIKRKTQPGKDLWALPGGFLNENETLRQGVLRELMEETKLKVPPKILATHIQDQNPIPFDSPGRSSRGRTLTHVFLFNLQADPEDGLSRVKGSDDAKEAKWFPLNEFEKMPKQMFEDHYFIGEHFIKQL